MIADLKRGDIVFVDLGIREDGETPIIRPYLIVKIYPHSEQLFIVGIFRQDDIDDDAFLGGCIQAEKGEGGLDFDFFVDCKIDGIIHKDQILKRTGCLSTGILDRVDRLFKYSPPILSHARKGDLAFVKQLLEQGESANTRRTGGETPLHMAVLYGHKDMVDLLIAEGADVNVKDDKDITPLHCALERKGSKDIAELLIAKGADMSAKDKKSVTSLHLAASVGQIDIVKFLIEKGADVNAKDENVWTPLHYAARGGNEVTAELLIDRGANINVQDAKGLTPLDVARKYGRKDVDEVLKKYERKK